MDTSETAPSVRSQALAAAVLLVGAIGCAATQPAALSDGRVIDLTHAFDADTIYWPTEPGFRHERVAAGYTERGFYYASNHLFTPEHGGTHVDAPIHFHEKGHALDEVPVDQLIGPGVLVDVSQACSRDRDYEVRIEDLTAWEARHGRIPVGAIVLLRTGFGAFWPDRVRYMGTDERGPEAVAKLHFPGLAPSAASWLVEQRSIGAVGLDTPSIDHGPSQEFGSHVRLFEKNVPAIENVAHLDRLPERGFTVFALPMKIRGGSGGPTRVVAVLD
jgi:kynurenine formamidase